MARVKPMPLGVAQTGTSGTYLPDYSVNWFGPKTDRDFRLAKSLSIVFVLWLQVRAGCGVISMLQKVRLWPYGTLTPTRVHKRIV